MKKKRITAFRSCLTSALDSFKLVITLYSVYTVVCAVLGILLSLSLTNSEFYAMNGFLSGIYSALSNIDLLGLALGLVSAVWLFAKYTNYCSNNLIKSLPARDAHLFWSDFLVGLFGFLVPLLLGLVLQSVVGSLLEAASGADGVYSTLGVSYGLLLNYIFGYCIAVFCFAVSKGVLESCITFVVLNFIPSVITSFVAFAKSCVLGTFVIDEFANKLNLSTTYDIIFRAICGTDDLTQITYIDILWVCLTIFGICVLLSALAFVNFIKLRGSERSNSKVKGAISAVAVSFLAFYCGFLVLFFKRTAISVFNGLVIIPTMLIASFIVFYIANTIIEKSIHIPFRRFIPYAVIGAALIFVGSLYFSCGFGAAYDIPTIGEVQSVTINYADDEYKEQIQSIRRSRFEYGKFLAQYDLVVDFPVQYSDYRSIATVIDYHEALLAEYGEHGMIETSLQNDGNFAYSAEDPGRTEISYQLKDGSTLTRYYNYNGSTETVSGLLRLNEYDNSISLIDSRAKSFTEGEPDASITHTLYVAPIFSDDESEIFTLTDAQLRELVKCIYEDEQNLTAADILDPSKVSDVCSIMITPSDYALSEDETYFAGVFNNYNETCTLYVKSCYNKTVDYLTNTVGAADAMVGRSSSEVLQIFAGKWGDTVAVQNGRYYSQEHFSYSSRNLYTYDYYGCTRLYNRDSVSGTVDSGYTNNAAIEFIISKLHLSAFDELSEGMCVVLNFNIVTPFETEEQSGGRETKTAFGKCVYYVTAADWAQFLSMNN